MATELSQSDASLVAAGLGGDQHAFGLLVERYYGTVWAIAYARLARPDAADDLAQEVFLVAYMHLGQLTDPDRFAGWLSQITHTRAVDWLRHNQRTSRLVAMVPTESLLHASAKVEEPAMDKHDQLQAVQQEIFSLPETQREMVLLKYIEGLSQLQIAQRLGVNPATVSRQLEKALATLRVSLNDDSLAALKPIPTSAGITRTLAIVAATAGLSESARAAIMAASGGVPVLAGAAVGAAATGSASESILSGVVLMETTKSVVLPILACLVIVGGIVAICYQGSRIEPQVISFGIPVTQTLPPASVDAPLLPAMTNEEMLLSVRQECFPREVEAEAERMAMQAIERIDPTRRIYQKVQASAVDHTGRRWFAFKYLEFGDGSGVYKLGNYTSPGLMGIMPQGDTGVLAVDLEPIGNDMFRASARMNDWPAGEGRVIGLLMEDITTKLTPGPDGKATMSLANWPGIASIQQLILVANSNWKLSSSTEPPAMTQAVGSFSIYLWQKHIKDSNDGYSVDVVMEKSVR